MTVTRRPTPRPELDPRDAEIAWLRNRIRLAVATLDVAMRQHPGNRIMCDSLLDVRNLLVERRQP